MIRVSTKPRKHNSPRISEKSAPAFLQWLRGRECLFAPLGGCEGKIEAMHLDFAGGKGMSSKVADRYAVPGCSGHHRGQHLVGWKSFMAEICVSESTLLSAADAFWRAWPGRIAWERKQEGGQ